MMYSIRQTADIFGVHWQTVRNWISEGKLHAIKIGKCVRIDSAEIQRIKSENAMESEAK